MNELPIIEAEIVFIPQTEGGREKPPPLDLTDSFYRPHLVVGDPNQRRAVLAGNRIQETYIGVQFQPIEEKIEFNKPVLAELILMFYPHPSYDALVPTATFTVREGAKIVGYGQVKRLLQSQTAVS